jgi:hypothetical protein
VKKIILILGVVLLVGCNPGGNVGKVPEAAKPQYAPSKISEQERSQLRKALEAYTNASTAELLEKENPSKAAMFNRRAFTLYSPLAEQGVAEAQYMIGMMHGSGRGTPQDYVKAAEWYRKAAEQEHAVAQSSLGRMLHFGREGVPQDHTEAASWLLKASEQGDWAAQSTLADMYKEGVGVPKDLVSAYMWYDVSVPLHPAAGIQEEIVRQRDEMAREMTPDQIKEAQILSQEWLKAFKTRSKLPPFG